MKLRPLPLIEVAVAVLRSGGKVWIQERQNTEHLQGYWEFPGGKLQEGETPSQTLQREIREELGLELKEIPRQPFWIEDYDYPERRVRIYFFLIELESELSLPSGLWVTPQELDRFPFPPANQRVIERLRSM